MDENAVVNVACKRLEAQGFIITQRCSTTERGIDIIAEDSSTGRKLLVEAKGGTSSKESSVSFGIAYNSNKVRHQVAMGVFTCIKLRAEYPDRSRYSVMLAVPDSPLFRTYLEPVLAELKRIDVESIFVTESDV
jgi:Holliday junction resolvase-like predicted endonuclease